MSNIESLMEFIKKNAKSHYEKLLFDEKRLQSPYIPFLLPDIHNKYLHEYQKSSLYKSFIDKLIEHSQRDQLAKNFIAYDLIRKTFFI